MVAASTEVDKPMRGLASVKWSGEFATIELFGGPADGTFVSVPTPLPSHYIVLILPMRAVLFSPSLRLNEQAHIYRPTEPQSLRYLYCGEWSEKETPAET